MKKYPIGIQTFSKIREGGYVYVDKTPMIYEIVSNGGYYFLSRPRRLGKSLLLSTMEAYFLGRRNLFDGLAIEEMEREWNKYPVFHLDLNSQKYEDGAALGSILNTHLSRWETLYGSEDYENTYSTRFAGVIRRACEKTGCQVVILIDEYDKPLLAANDLPKLQDDYRETLKAFYGVLKSCDRYIRFGFLTGVTKFSKVSVFSDLNNLTDISMMRRFATICGITEEELHQTFDEEIMELASANHLSKEQAYDKLRQMYDGYHFHPMGAGVYNPFSLLNTLYSHEFGYYWFSTGTPTFLIDMLKKGNYDLKSLPKSAWPARTLNELDTLNNNPVPILYQSGYLTITGRDDITDGMLVDFPNEEVQQGFLEMLLPAIAEKNDYEVKGLLRQLVVSLMEGNPNGFMEQMKAMLSDIPYETNKAVELNFRNIMYVTFTLLGFNRWIERPVLGGRIDNVLTTSNYIYIFEYKLNKTAEEAIEQINAKEYAAPFATDTRTIFKIGVNFTTASKNIEKWIVEKA